MLIEKTSECASRKEKKGQQRISFVMQSQIHAVAESGHNKVQFHGSVKHKFVSLHLMVLPVVLYTKLYFL